jgi:16S rRNA (cytosine967-C5)-methyltransferase
MSLARASALRVYEAVEHGNATLPDALAIAQAGLADPRDRALTAEIVAGTFRWKAAIDHALAAQATRPLDKLDPIVLGILRLSAYQLLYLDRVPARAVVFDAVAMTRTAKKTSASGFVNAVLRKLTRADRATLWRSADDPAYLTITLSHPQWLADRWRTRYGFDAAATWARFNNAPAPLTLRVNETRISRDELQRQLADLGVETVPTTFAPHGLLVRTGQPLQTPLARAGLFITQDEASQLVACLAQAAIPAPCGSSRAPATTASETTPAGEAAIDSASTSVAPRRRILDACASPGGKTVALASSLGPADVIVATDRRSRRIRLLIDTLTAAGCRRPADTALGSGVTSASTEAARDPHVHVARLDLEKGLPFSDVFDLILVDAPCSGLGTLRREPEIRWRRTEGDLARFAAQQQRMLTHAATGIAPGGRLVYATCSSEPDENEAVAAAFLAATPSFRALSALDLTLPAALAPVINEAGHLRTLPHVHGLEAFFAAVFERTTDVERTPDSVERATDVERTTDSEQTTDSKQTTDFERPTDATPA